MEPLEVFKVEATIESESESYKDIASDVMSNLEVARIIGRLYIKIKPEIILFQMVLILRDRLPEIKTIDFSNVIIGTDGKIVINISDEKYIPDLLRKLWIEYGKTNINQIERKRIKVDVQKEHKKSLLEQIEKLIIYDPNRMIKKKISEMAIRIAPEGFRVRWHSFKGEQFIFVATEEVMKPEWIEEAKDMLHDLNEVR